MDNNVRYTVTAQDLLSGKLKGMDVQAKGLESTLGGIKNILGTVGVGFAVFKGLDFISDGVEKFHKLHQAQAQVKAGLESTGFAAGISARELDEMATQTSKSVNYSRSDITELQSLMLTFPAIVKDKFPQATQTILDMSTRLGQDTKSSAIQLGKALQDPIRGITALRRVGVNFNSTQVETIKKLVESGQAAKAQGMILSELNTEFGGSAKAAYDADPIAKFKKMMGSLQMSMGKFAVETLEFFVPALESVAGVFKSTGEFIQEYKTELLAIGGAYLTYKSILLGMMVVEKSSLLLKGLQITASEILLGWEMARAEGMGVLTAAQWALNVAMDANPIGAVIAGLTIIVGVFYEAWQRCEEFRGVIFAVWAVIKTAVGIWVDMFKAFGEIIAGVLTLNPATIAEGFNKATTVMYESGKRLAEATKNGYNAGIKDFHKEDYNNMAIKDVARINEMVETGTIKTLKEYNEKINKFKETIGKHIGVDITKEQADKTLAGLKGFTKNGASTTTAKAKGTSGVKGNQPININVTIGSLIHDFKINTTNIQESAKAIHDKVTQALTAAVNDSQTLASQ